jgi:hypothetical protein
VLNEKGLSLLPFNFEKDIARAAADIRILLVDDLALKTQSLQPGVEAQSGGALMNACGAGFADHLINITLQDATEQRVIIDDLNLILVLRGEIERTGEFNQLLQALYIFYVPEAGLGNQLLHLCFGN